MLIVSFLVKTTTPFATPRIQSLQSTQLLGGDSLAQNPLTINPRFQQQTYLKASNTESSDEFGLSVAIDNNLLVVGATGEDSDATGVNGDQDNNLKPNSGAVYIFTKRGNNWVQQAYLKASNTSTGSSFGRSVAVNGQTVVVGAPFEDSNTTGVNADQDNTEALNSGAVYVFTRNGDTWSQQAYLKASNTDAFDLFGESVAIDGDTIVVGASNALGSAGAAYVFTQRNGSWVQQASLQAPVEVLQSGFGDSVAIADNTIVIGAPAFGEINSSADSRPGAVFIYRRQNSVWDQQAILTASNAHGSAQFGGSVAISGDSVVVGARFENNNGSRFHIGRDASGAAYVFTRNNGIWTQQSRLQATNTEAEDRFGGQVAIVDNTIVIGANGEDSISTGVNPDPADNSANASGAAYVFTRNNGIWNQQTYLKASNTDQFDSFGSSAALTRDSLVVGTHFEDSNATGNNGDPTNNEASNAGAVYVFNLLSTQSSAGNSVSGLVWLDNNGDGLLSDGEPAFTQSVSDFGGLVLALFPEDSQQPIDVFYLNTNSTGRYAFYDVPAGRYFVCTNTVFLQLGLSVTTQNAGDDAIDSDFDTTPCASDIIISDTQSARLDLGLTGGPFDQPDDTVDTGNLANLTVKTSSLLINHQWRPANNTVNTANSVIFYSAPSSNGGQRGVARMRRINNRIEFKFQEWSNLDGVHVNEIINLVSFPRGSWNDANTQIEVDTAIISGTRKWKTIRFANAFPAPPVVILNLQTANGGDAVDVHVRNITTESMQIALFEEEAKINSGHITETVGFLAMTSNSSSVDLGTASTRIELPFNSTGVEINHNWKSIGNGYLIRLEEDQTSDQETFHVNETVHVIKINNHYFTQIASANGGDPSVLRSRTVKPGPQQNPELLNPEQTSGAGLKTNQISGLVWLDTNADGLRNTNEPGFVQAVPEIGFMSVALYPVGSTDAVAVAFLDESSQGRYLFENIEDGDYYLCTNTVFDLLGLSVTIQDAGDNAIDSDFDVTPCSYDISVSGGQLVTRDLGLVGEIPDPVDPVVHDGSRINGTVWIDANQNALIDDNENGVSAVVGIYALPEKVGSFVKHIVTDENGFYEFTNLATGEYKVVVNGTNVPTSISDFNSNVTIDFPVDNISSGIIKVDGETCTLRNALIVFIFDQKIGDCRLTHPSIAAKIVLKPGSNHVLGSLPRAVNSPGLGYPFVVGSVIRPPSGIVIYGNGARIDRVSSASPDSAAYLNSTVNLVNVSLDTVRCASVIYSIDHANIGSVDSTHDAVGCSISHSNIGSTSGFGLSADGYRVSSSVISGFAGGIGWLSNSTIEDTFSPVPGFGGGSTIISSTINKIIGGHIGRIQNSVIGGVSIDEFTAQSPNALDGCLNDQRILDPQCLLDLNDAG